MIGYNFDIWRKSGLCIEGSTPEHQEELEKAFGEYAQGKEVKDAVGKLISKRISSPSQISISRT